MYKYLNINVEVTFKTIKTEKEIERKRMRDKEIEKPVAGV